MTRTDIQKILNFINTYYPSSEPSNFEELLQGNSVHDTHRIFLSRLQRACEKLELTIPIEDINELWTHIINECANKMIRLLHKQGLNSYELTPKTGIVLEGKAALLAVKLEEPSGPKRKGDRDEAGENDRVDGGYAKMRKMNNGFTGILQPTKLEEDNESDGQAGSVMWEEFADTVDMAFSQSLPRSRKIMPMKKRAVASRKPLGDFDEMDLDF